MLKSFKPSLFLLVAILALLLGLALNAHSQLNCAAIGNTVTCISPNGSVTQQQNLNPTTGIVIGPDGNLQTYTIMSPNAPSLPSNQLPGPGGRLPEPPGTGFGPVLVMPTPSVSGY